MKCLDCQEEVPEHVRSCVICGCDVGYPNVRAADCATEVKALGLRVNEAEKNADTHGYKSVLVNFRNVIAQSAAVVCLPLGKLSELVSSDNQLYVSFYKAVGNGMRLPENNDWDKTRESVDSLLFPHYHKNIIFGALSIDRKGISGYGFGMVLKEMAINNRASVLEENGILFVRGHNIVAGDSIPLGYRAPWKERSSLAIAKLGKRLTIETTETEFARLLLSSDDRDSDCIEVHIYGPLHRRAIEHLTGHVPRSRADKVILKSVAKKLMEIGATVEIS